MFLLSKDCSREHAPRASALLINLVAQLAKREREKEGNIAASQAVIGENLWRRKSIDICREAERGSTLFLIRHIPPVHREKLILA